MKILSAPFVLFAFASAATAAMAASRSPYGACAHLPRDEFEQRDGILRLMREAGIANVRFDIDWTAWEKDHALPRVAAVLDSAGREGVTALPILNTAPRSVLPVAAL